MNSILPRRGIRGRARGGGREIISVLDDRCDSSFPPPKLEGGVEVLYLWQVESCPTERILIIIMSVQNQAGI